jgi:nucleoid DNA-binding protein
MTGKTITRADLYAAVYVKLGLSRSKSRALVEMVFEEITDTLTKGETVKLSSFGLFIVRKKKQRIGRKPKSGTPGVQILGGHEAAGQRQAVRYQNGGRGAGFFSTGPLRTRSGYVRS